MISNMNSKNNQADTCINLSYRKAADEVVSEYKKTIRYRDVEFETEHIQERIKEMGELRKV